MADNPGIVRGGHHPLRPAENQFVPNITHKMLSSQLKGLEKMQLISRKVYNQIPAQGGVFFDEERNAPVANN